MNLSPEMSPGMRCIKYLLVLFNLMFVITGLCVIVVGSTINSLYNEYAHFLEAKFMSPTVTLIIIGTVILVVSFFGCFGALKESTCMVTTFTISLGFIFIVEFCVGMSGYFLQKEVKIILVHRINETMHEYTYDESAQITINKLQEEFQCCGVMSPDDWQGILSPPNSESIQVPSSCCAIYDNHNQCLSIYERGCLPQLTYMVKESEMLLAATAVTIAVLQLVGVMFAYSLGRMIRMQKTERERLRWEMRERLLNSYTAAMANELKSGDIGPVMYMTISEPQKPPSPPPQYSN